MTKPAIFLAALLLSACRDAQPPLPTSEQSDQLNEAESMLDDMAKEKGPEANAPGPSNASE